MAFVLANPIPGNVRTLCAGREFSTTQSSSSGSEFGELVPQKAKWQVQGHRQGRADSETQSSRLFAPAGATSRTSELCSTRTQGEGRGRIKKREAHLQETSQLCPPKHTHTDASALMLRNGTGRMAQRGMSQGSLQCLQGNCKHTTVR